MVWCGVIVRRNKGQTPRDLAASLDTESKTCKMRKLLDDTQVTPRRAICILCRAMDKRPSLWLLESGNAAHIIFF